MTRIAINGFGRIGRAVVRAIVERDSGVEIVAVNDLGGIDQLARLLRFDTTLGRIGYPVEVSGDVLRVAGRTIRVLAEPDPAKLPWAELDIDIVLESTGRFTTADDARVHQAAGAKKVLVSAPSAGADVTLAYGVNSSALATEHVVISSASCTTNALAPLAKVLDDLGGIEQGFMTTVHAYTADQNLEDGPHRDPRRARAAAVNIIPASTGAAKAIGLVLPGLDGKLSGDAIRVPVPVGSIVELNAAVSREVTSAQVLSAYEAAAAGPLKGILAVESEPVVSSDIVGRAESAIVDAELIRVAGRHVKVSAWYDNEWGFSNRVVDNLELIGSLNGSDAAASGERALLGV